MQHPVPSQMRLGRPVSLPIVPCDRRRHSLVCLPVFLLLLLLLLLMLLLLLLPSLVGLKVSKVRDVLDLVQLGGRL